MQVSLTLSFVHLIFTNFHDTTGRGKDILIVLKDFFGKQGGFLWDLAFSACSQYVEPIPNLVRSFSGRSVYSVNHEAL